MREWFVSFIIIILVSCLIVHCNNTDYKSYSTIIKEQRDSISSLMGKIAQMSDSLIYYKTILTNKDSIIFENYTLKYKINRIKQYDSIVIRNSSQSKYFRGWVRRVIYDY